MAESFKGQQCVWGTTSANVTGGGLVVDASVDEQAATEAVEGRQGDEVGLVIYDRTWTLSATVVCQSTTQEPAIGAQFSVGGKTGYVTGCRRQWQNKGKKQLTITAHGGASLSGTNG